MLEKIKNHQISQLLKKRFMRLGNDERGVVFYYTALVSFFIIAILSMVYDVSRLSEDKIQLQNAADSAALEMAVWKARGLNLTQNINNEIYDTDKVLSTVYGIAGGMTIIGDALLASFFLAEVGEVIIQAAGVMARLASGFHRFIVTIFLKNVRKVYVDGSVLMGYVGANNVASHNGAESIIPAIPTPHSGSGLIDVILGAVVKAINGLDSGFVAVGIPTSATGALKLPLTQEIPNGMNDHVPLKVSTPSGNGWFDTAMDALYTNEDAEGIERWYDKPYRSTNSSATSQPPMIWIVHKKNKINFISSYFVGGKRDFSGVPILAYSLGQVKGGNVTKRSSYSNQFRPKYYGVGADAFIAPMSAIDLSKSESIGSDITIKISIQNYVNKFFPH